MFRSNRIEGDGPEREPRRPAGRGGSDLPAETSGAPDRAPAIPGPSMSGSSEAEPRISLTVIANVLLIWKWHIMAIVGLFCALGFIYLQFQPFMYTASSSVRIAPPQANILDIESVVQGLPGDTATIQAEIEVMRSRNLIDRVIDRAGLVNDPDFSPNARLGDDPQAEPLSDLDNRVFILRDVSQSLDVRQVGLTPVVEMQFTASTPDKAANIANIFVSEYIAMQLEAKTNAMDEIGSALSERLSILRQRVQEQEDALSDARASEVLVDGQTIETVDGQIRELSQQLVQARIERIRAEATLDNLRRLDDAGESMEVLLEFRDTPVLTAMAQQREELRGELASLRTQFLSRHPQVVQVSEQLASVDQQIRDELASQSNKLRIQYESAVEREEQISQTLRQLEARKATVNDALQRVRELERAATVEQRLYENSLTRLREIDEQRSYIAADASIIEKAVPPLNKSAPNRRLIMAFAFFAGSVVALGTILVAETTRDAFTNPAAVFVHTGVPVSGVLPRLRGLSVGPDLSERLSSSVSGREALETARRILLTHHGRTKTGETRVMGITGALPGDGSAFTSMLLAQVSAGMQRRTLLIDSDLRKPGIDMRELEEQPGVEGLNALISNEQTTLGTTWRHPDLPLYILPAITDPTEIGFDQHPDIKLLRRIVDDARAEFDVIIVRMPPVLPSSDSLTVASIVDEFLFVLRWNKTKQGSVLKGLGELSAVGLSPSAMVMNAADMKSVNQRDFYGQNFDYQAVRDYYA